MVGCAHSLEPALERACAVACRTARAAVVVRDHARREHRRHPGDHLSFCGVQAEVFGTI